MTRPVKLTAGVCIPTINGRERMLARAVQSVQRQRRPADAILIQRDGLREGAAQTRNKLLARAEEAGVDCIAWLDDDDAILPNHLMACMRVLELDQSVDLVYPVPRFVGGGDPTATSVGGRWVAPWGVRFTWEQEDHLRRHGSFIPMTHVVRTAAVRKAGGFPIPGTPEWPRPNVEDWGYLIRLLDSGAKFEHLNAKTWLWHVSHGRHTGGQGNR